MNTYVTTYCNKAHDKADGKPIEHECRIIPVEALRAEWNGDFEAAIDIISKSPAKWMRRGKAAT